MSFEDSFDAELAAELGDLGPDSRRERAGADEPRRWSWRCRGRDRRPRSPPSPLSSVTERITTLDNGLTIATDRVPEARSVAIGVWVAVGSRDEPAELAGVSHFLEHLLFKGTATRSAHRHLAHRRPRRRRHQRLHVEGVHGVLLPDAARATGRPASSCSATC